MSSFFTGLQANLLRLTRSRGFDLLGGMIWAAALLLLPVTSLPLLQRVSGATTVAPPSSALFLLLAFLWLLPYLLSGGRLPLEVAPLLLWMAAALVSWGAALFLQMPHFRDQNLLSQAKETIITLAMGLSACLSAAGWISARGKRMDSSIKVITIGGAVLVAWSLLQSYFVLLQGGQFPIWVERLQEALSSRHEPLFSTRLTGMAYEPSWLAHQFALVYLPLWLSAVIYGYSSFRPRLGFLTVESVLLVLGIFTLFFTLSRVGIISFSLVAAYLTFRAVIHLTGKISDRVLRRRNAAAAESPRAGSKLARVTVTAGIMAVFSVALLGAVIGFFYISSKFDPRMKRIFEYDFSTTTGFYQLTNQMSIAERVVYWATGLNIFEDHPVLGVGLGGAGFYFPQKMPDYGYALWEVSRLFGFDDVVPNTKSLWVRVLAETGLVGFAIFAAWLFLLWQSGRLARSAASPAVRAAGLAGQLTLVAFLAEGFSIDSFALPYIWLILGVLSAAGLLARRELLMSARGDTS